MCCALDMCDAHITIGGGMLVLLHAISVMDRTCGRRACQKVSALEPRGPSRPRGGDGGEEISFLGLGGCVMWVGCS